MKQKWKIFGFSILTVFLILLSPLGNSVGYLSVQPSQKETIKEAVTQRELFYQTIVDFTNNKDIQRTILESEIRNGIFPKPDTTYSLTKNQLKQMYFIGLILSKVINKSRMQSIIGKYQFNHQEIQKKIPAIIETNSSLKKEITQLQNSECDCGNERTTSEWKFPVICTTLFFIMVLLIYVILFFSAIFRGPIGDIVTEYFFFMMAMVSLVFEYFNCTWPYNPY